MVTYRPIGSGATLFSYVVTSHSIKVKEFELFFFPKNNTTNLDFLNFNFSSEQLTVIIHSSRQENLHNNACVGLL